MQNINMLFAYFYSMNKGELKIVKTLLRGSFTVKEIASAIGLSLSQTYRNLKKL
ncbi:MAG: hypothetical protein DRJ60_07405, partial [Thermoprotei archaeon]